MPKKSRNKNVKGMSIQELRDQLAQREKQVMARIAELEKKKKALLGQVTNTEERIETLKEELSAKAPRRPTRKKASKRAKQKKPARISKAARKKVAAGKKKKAKKLQPGALKNALIEIFKESKGSMGPTEIREAVIAKKIYTKAPKYLRNVIDQKLKGPEFKRVGKGKYVLKKKSGK